MNTVEPNSVTLQRRPECPTWCRGHDWHELDAYDDPACPGWDELEHGIDFADDSSVWAIQRGEADGYLRVEIGGSQSDTCVEALTYADWPQAAEDLRAVAAAIARAAAWIDAQATLTGDVR